MGNKRQYRQAALTTTQPPALCVSRECDLPQTRSLPNASLMLASIVDGGPALIQHWVNVSCLLGGGGLRTRGGDCYTYNTRSYTLSLNIKENGKHKEKRANV